MSKEERRVPELRFKGFHDDWEQRKLKDISNKVREKNDNNVYRVTLTNSAELGIVNQSSYFDKSISNLDSISGYYIVHPNDFVYNPRISKFAPVGPIKKNNLSITGVMSPLYYVFRTHDIHNSYLEQYFKSSYWHKFMYRNGDSGARADRFAIKDKILVEMPVPYPKKNEQSKIATLLTLLDNTINLHQRRSNILKRLRQNYMFTMFINSEKLSPKLRFRNYKEDWIEHRLGEVGDTFSGLSGKTKEDFGHGEAEYVTYLNVFNNRIADSSLTEKIEIDSKQKSLRYGDVLFTTSSEVPNEVGMSSIWLNNRENVYLNSFCFGFRPSITFDHFFFATLLRTNNIRKQMYILAQGISRYNISKLKAMNIKIHTPSLKEQEKIGNIAKIVDEEYKLLKKKIFKLQEIKKSFLQKMFL